jgi:hypothetical protein
MTTTQIILLVAVILTIDGMIVGAILSAAGQSLREFSRAFPRREMLAGTRTRHFQSVRLGMSNLGGFVHVAIDGNCVHLHPSWIARKLRMETCSIPHACIEVEAKKLEKAKRRVRGLTAVRLRSIEGVRAPSIDVALPAWAVAASLTLREEGGVGSEGAEIRAES